jgi:hypothetical protein
MPPLDFTSPENLLSVTKMDNPLTTGEHPLKNSTAPLKNQSTASQKPPHGIEIERDAGNSGILH